MDSSLPEEVITDIVRTLPRYNSEDEPYPHSLMAKKEHEVIHSNRVKLTDYIHDSTVLFPYMKQHGIFSVYDCDVIKGETVAHNRMDKFIDVLFTKGPKAIGVFHESLAKTYPGVFDYLTRLFTSADIDLSESRRMRPASIIDQVPDIPSYDNVSEQENVDAISQSADDDMKYWGRNISKRGLTVRRSLDVLSRQLDAIQKERNELKNALSFKEKEISDLIRSKDKNRDDLLSITQHYQEIYRNLVDWKESLTSDNSQRIQELLAERECIQAEYDALENDYTLVQLELRAARERISRLMNHLERSEQLVAFAHEERDSLQNKVLQLEGEIQKLERKNQRNYGAGRGGGGRKDAEIEQLTKQIEKSLKDIEDLRSENAELLDRLTVARQERSEALIEKDKILQKQYLEEQNRKKAENEVKNLLKRLQSLKETTESQSSEESNSLHTTSHEVNNYVVKMEDFTTVIQASEDMGMCLGLGVLVANITDDGLASKCGIKHGDQICQVNHITVTSDPDPLDLCRRLLQNASKFVTLLIRRPVLSNDITSTPPNSSTHTGLTMPKIHQSISSKIGSPGDTSTMNKFSLPLNSLPSTSATTNNIFQYHTFDCGVKNSNKINDAISPETHHHMSLGDKTLKKEFRGKLHRNKRKYSDDNSIYTSSSDDYPDITLTDSVNTGIVHSPDANPFKFHDVDLPVSVTRPPTLIEESNIFKFDEEYFRDKKDTIDSVDVSPSTTRPQYLPMFSIPADISSAPLTPKLKRAEAKRWMYKFRRSQSLVDIPTQFQDTLPSADLPTDKKLRKIVLPWGKLGEGVSIVGGRGWGLFIHSKKDDGRGLQTGDQLIRIGDVYTDNMMYRDAVLTLDAISKRENQCILTVCSNMEGYGRLPSLNQRDDFHIKALFEHKKGTISKEFTFKEGEVFKVVDTYPDEFKTMLKARKVNSYGIEEGEGYLPINILPLNDWEQIQANSLPPFFRFPAGAQRLNSTPETFHYTREESKTNFKEFYQPTKRVSITAPRPVIILGICENEVREYLLEETLFSLPPVKSHRSLATLNDECSQDCIQLKRTGENVRYCLVSDIIAIGENDQHCLLSVEPCHLKNINKSLNKLHPIVLFLYTKKTGAFGFRMQVHNCSSETVNKYLTDMRTIGDLYSQYFTGRVEVSGGLENIAKLVKIEISNQQQMAVWEPDYGFTRD